MAILGKIKLNKEVKYIFIPKNSGLKSFTEKALDKLIFDKKYIKIVERRGEDIPRIVEELALKNIASIGLTGDDLYDEFRFSKNSKGLLQLLMTTDWIDKDALYGRPVLALLGKNNDLENFINLKEMPKIGIPKKYLNTSRRYLKNIFHEKFQRKQMKIYSGGIEENIKLGLYDFAIDIVFSGKSIKREHLKILEIIRGSDFSTIGPCNIKLTRPLKNKKYENN